MTKVTIAVELTFNDDSAANRFFAEATGPDRNGVRFSQDFANAVLDPEVGFQVTSNVELVKGD